MWYSLFREITVAGGSYRLDLHKDGGGGYEE